MRHVVMFSGGVGSWATASRVAERHGTDDLVLLFADTLVEDPDLYRFMREAAEQIGGELVVVADGRTPFEIFKHKRFLGNARLANCSDYLKQRPCRAWLEEHCDPDATTLYVGIDWTEEHRLPAIHRGWAPWPVEAPMTERPYLDKPMMLAALAASGIEPPRAYAEGFPHNNCLQQGCVRGGQAYWRRLRETRPEVYEATAQAELDLRDFLGADVAILRDRSGGGLRPLTLEEFGDQLGQQGTFDALDWGGCGCFVDGPA